jgi:predicted dehydrogenase
MPKHINWGIIGLGNIANKFAQDLLLVKNSVLYGVASRDIEKSKSFAKKYNSIHYYNSYQELANDPNIDIVYVATPHTYHFFHTMLCLKSGKAVLCEKPLGMNSREVITMIELARSNDLFIMEALWTRFIPGTEKLLELLKSDTIGKIDYLKADFGFVGNTDPERRVYNRSLGGGSLLDIGIYPIYLSLLLMGLPNILKATANFTPTGVDSFCSILFDYNNGKMAFLESTILANTPIEAIIRGENGSIKMHRSFHHTKKISILKNDNTSETISIDYKGNGYYHEIVEVMGCLLNKKIESDKMPHSMSIGLVETLDKVREQIGLTYPSDVLQMKKR